MILTFKDVSMPAAVRKECAAALKSWRTLHSALKGLTVDTNGLAHLERLISVELSNPEGPRAHILMRLHMRFNSMRQKLEFSKIIGHATR